jgi:hypothetical protein
MAHAATNLVSDGDFSTPNEGGGFSFVPNGGVGGWTNQTEGVLEVGANGVYGLGCYSSSICQNLEVNANGFDTVSQTISGLVVGETYTVSWAYGGRNGGGPQALNVSFGGAPLTQDTSDGLADDAVWSPNSFTVKAATSTETLTFASVVEGSGSAPSFGNELTNVSVVAVPEPAAWALMLMGFGSVGAAMRSRRKTATVAA